MFYISNLKGLQSPFKSRKKKTIVTEAGSISDIESESVSEELPDEGEANKNPYQKQLNKEELQRKLPKFAKDVMSSPVFTINQNKTSKDANQIFRSKRYRHIPVVDDSSILVGIISDRNIFSVKDDVLIQDAMSKDIVTARPDASIRSISEVLIEERIGCIPVVSDNNELQGIITRTDILRSLVRDAPLDLVF